MGVARHVIHGQGKASSEACRILIASALNVFSLHGVQIDVVVQEMDIRDHNLLHHFYLTPDLESHRNVNFKNLKNQLVTLQECKNGIHGENNGGKKKRIFFSLLD